MRSRIVVNLCCLRQMRDALKSEDSTSMFYCSVSGAEDPIRRQHQSLYCLVGPSGLVVIEKLAVVEDGMMIVVVMWAARPAQEGAN